MPGPRGSLVPEGVPDQGDTWSWGVPGPGGVPGPEGVSGLGGPRMH